MAGTIHSEMTVEATDPRILRSRKMLMAAFDTLLQTRDFSDISIQEIADEATLSRATFYLHYPDKESLLRAVTADQFRSLVAGRGLTFDDCEGALYAIALGVCDFFAITMGCPTSLSKMSFEDSVIPVLEDMFRAGASHHVLKPGVTAAVLASTAAWAVFGAARQWFQDPKRIPSSDMAKTIEALVTPVFLSAVVR